jgi:hypothetical protein
MAAIAEDRRGGTMSTQEEERKEWGDKVLRDEDKSWDFLVGQMADWEERERNLEVWRRQIRRWEKDGARKSVVRRLGRRIGTGSW